MAFESAKQGALLATQAIHFPGILHDKKTYFEMKTMPGKENCEAGTAHSIKRWGTFKFEMTISSNPVTFQKTSP
jgi:hypothetical protein